MTEFYNGVLIEEAAKLGENSYVAIFSSITEAAAYLGQDPDDMVSSFEVHGQHRCTDPKGRDLVVTYRG